MVACAYTPVTTFLHQTHKVNSRLDGLCDRANLVDFKQQAVAGLFLHGSLYPARVSDCQIVSNHLQMYTTQLQGDASEFCYSQKQYQFYYSDTLALFL